MIGAANLIPAPRRRARAARARVRVWGAACTALALALMGAFASLSSIESGDQERLELALARGARTADNLERDVASAKARNGDLSRKLAITKAMVDHPDWSVLLSLVSSTRPRQVMLERVALKAAEAPKDAKGVRGGPPLESYVVRIGGLAGSQSDVMNYVGALERTGMFDSVRPPETRSREVVNRELVGFDIECTISARALESAGKDGGAP